MFVLNMYNHLGVSMKDSDYCLEIPKQDQRPVPLPVSKKIDHSTENKKADSEIILNKECKKVKLVNGKN